MDAKKSVRNFRFKKMPRTPLIPRAFPLSSFGAFLKDLKKKRVERKSYTIKKRNSAA